MKTAILYASPHHHNTEKLVKAIAEKHPDENDINNAVLFYENLI